MKIKLAVPLLLASIVVSTSILARGGDVRVSAAAGTSHIMGQSEKKLDHSGRVNSLAGTPGTQTSMVLAVVGRLKAGSRIETLQSNGHHVGWALQNYGGVAQNPLFVAYSSNADATVNSLRNDPEIAGVGLLLAQSGNPRYASSNYRLADSPGAQVLVSQAVRAMVAGGYATVTQLNDPGTVFLISDDPTAAGSEIVTAELNSSVSRQALDSFNKSGGLAPGSTTFLAAEFDPSLRVTAVGLAAWFSETPQTPLQP